MGELDGRVLVIVGGTSGIGLSATRACLAAGARLVVVGLEVPEGLAAELGSRGEAIAADARDPGAARSAVGRAVEAFGGFHGLFHVAGGSGRAFGDGPLHEVSEEGWEKTLALNLTSTFHSNRAAIDQLLRQGTPGSILNTSSVIARAPSPRHFSTHAYAAAKAGVEGLTLAAAAHYAPHGIRLNAIAPGLVDTPMSRRAMGDPEIVKFVEGKQPLDGGRAGRPSDIDAAAVYFLSDQSRFVTGQVLAIDGGWGVSEGAGV